MSLFSTKYVKTNPLCYSCSRKYGPCFPGNPRCMGYEPVTKQLHPNQPNSKKEIIMSNNNQTSQTAHGIFTERFPGVDWTKPETGFRLVDDHASTAFICDSMNEYRKFIEVNGMTAIDRTEKPGYLFISAGNPVTKSFISISLTDSEHTLKWSRLEVVYEPSNSSAALEKPIPVYSKEELKTALAESRPVVKALLFGESNSTQKEENKMTNTETMNEEQPTQHPFKLEGTFTGQSTVDLESGFEICGSTTNHLYMVNTIRQFSCFVEDQDLTISKVSKCPTHAFHQSPEYVIEAIDDSKKKVAKLSVKSPKINPGQGPFEFQISYSVDSEEKETPAKSEGLKLTEAAMAEARATSKKKDQTSDWHNPTGQQTDSDKETIVSNETTTKTQLTEHGLNNIHLRIYKAIEQARNDLLSQPVRRFSLDDFTVATHNLAEAVFGFGGNFSTNLIDKMEDREVFIKHVDSSLNLVRKEQPGTLPRVLICAYQVSFPAYNQFDAEKLTCQLILQRISDDEFVMTAYALK